MTPTHYTNSQNSIISFGYVDFWTKIFPILYPPLENSTTRITIMYVCYGNTGCQVFMRGVQNWKDFCLKINIPKRNYWILRIGVMGRCQKVPKFDIQSQFSMSKIIGIFLNFFSLKNTNLGAHFLFLTFFDNINF